MNAPAIETKRLYALNESSLPDVQVLSLNLADEIVLHEGNIIGIAHLNKKTAVVYAMVDENARGIMQTLYPDFKASIRGMVEGLILSNWDGTSPY